MDNQSVNSVSLDQEPNAPTSRLLVSSSVSIQDKSGRVVARLVLFFCIGNLSSVINIALYAFNVTVLYSTTKFTGTPQLCLRFPASLLLWR